MRKGGYWVLILRIRVKKSEICDREIGFVLREEGQYQNGIKTTKERVVSRVDLKKRKVEREIRGQ